MQSVLQYRHINRIVYIGNSNRPPSDTSGEVSPVRVSVDDEDDDDDDEIPKTVKTERRRGSNANNGSIPASSATRLVEWDGFGDPGNPRNWSMNSKLVVTALVWINVFTLDWAASSNSQASSVISKYFGTSTQVELLSAALYTLGIASGAVFAGPISETVGRNPVYILSRIFHLVWVMGSALAPNIQTQLVCRYFAGLGASIILAIHGASIADIFGPYHRSLAWPFVACGSFYGTVLAPIAGGWITVSAQDGGLSWRWCDWIALIISGFAFILTFLFMPETFAPVLLSWKASALRKSTGDHRYSSEFDLQETFKKRLSNSFYRAWTMTTMEPIVTLLGLWLVMVYAVLFGFLQGFKYIFKETFGFSDGLKGTAFAGLALGITLYLAIVPLFQWKYKQQLIAWKADPSSTGSLPPEYRLQPAFVMALTFPVALFWLGWTNYSWIGPWPDLGAIALFGFSWAGIYNAVYLFILDVYGIYAGSALAAITVYRYGISAVMTIASEKMYESWGVHWVCTFLGILAGLLLPAPFFFWKCGARIRASSRFAGHHANDVAEEVIGQDSAEIDEEKRVGR